MQSRRFANPVLNVQAFRRPRIAGVWTQEFMRVGLAVVASVAVGLAVIVSTHYLENAKFLAGLVGGLAFVLLTMRWAELGILGLVALMSGLISLTWLPTLHVGPISLHISDFVLILLWGLVFLRVTAQPGFTVAGSPLILPLFLFIGAVMLSAVNAVLIFGVGPNVVLRTIRVLILWSVFIPTLQLVRDEQALRRLLTGLMMFAGALLIGVLLPNKLGPFLPVEETVLATGSRTYTGFTRIYYAGDLVLYSMIPVTVASLALIRKGNQLWRVGLLGLLVFWAFRTGFRQYWLTLCVVCVLLLGLISSRQRIRLLRRLVPAMGMAVLLLVVLLCAHPDKVEDTVHVLTDRVGSLLRDPLSREGSLQFRMIETRYALRQIARRPILGIGLANRYRPPMVAESGGTFYGDWTYKYIENGYLYVGMMMGLVGLIPFLWLCAAYLLRVFCHQRQIQDDGLRAIYLGFGVAFLGMVACNVATPTFVIGTRLVFFPLAMAIGEIILRIEREKARPEIASPSWVYHQGSSFAGTEGS